MAVRKQTNTGEQAMRGKGRAKLTVPITAPDTVADPFAVTDETPLEVGAAVQIEWGGTWWAGSVVAVQKNGTLRIHYDGYDNASDETVPRTRLRLPAPEQIADAAPVAATNPGPADTDPLRAVLSSRPVTAHTKLKAGDPVRVEWNGTWWAGSVVSLQSNGQVRIHYEGWDNSWDETVARSRLCLPPSGQPTVSVVFDNGQTLTGILTGSAGEFLVLSRDSDATRTLVNRQRILYLNAVDDG